MILKQIHIDGFGKLGPIDLELSEGMQVLAANNEQGKSTLLRFLQAVFYGLGDRKRNDPGKSRDRYKPWDGTNWGGYVVFAHEGQTYRLVRQFGEIRSRDQIQLFIETTGEPLPNPWTGDQQPGDYFFSLNASAFSLTTFIGQAPEDRTAADPSRESGLTSCLQTLIGNLDETVSYTEVRQRLDNARKILTARSNRRGSLAQLELQLQGLRGDLAGQQNRRREGEELTASIQSHEDEIRNLESKSALLQKRLDQLRQLEQHSQNLIQEYNRLEQAEGLVEQLDSLTHRLEDIDLSVAGCGARLQELDHSADQFRLAHRQGERLLEREEELQRMEAETTRALATHPIDPEEEPPWQIYERRQGESTRMGERLDRLHTLDQARKKLEKAQEALECASAHRIQAEQEQVEAEECLARLRLRIEPARIRLRKAQTEQVQQQMYCTQLRVALEERRTRRTQELQARQARYLLKLLWLARAAWAGCILGLLSLGLGFGIGNLLPTAAHQPMQVLGFLLLTGGAACAVHRSIFPPAKPTIVSEPDAEDRLAAAEAELERWNRENEAAQEALEQAEAKLEEGIATEQKNRLLMTQAIQTLETAKKSREESERELTALTASWGSSAPSSEALLEEVQTLEEKQKEWQLWQSQWLQERRLTSETQIPGWQAQAMRLLQQREEGKQARAQQRLDEKNWAITCAKKLKTDPIWKWANQATQKLLQLENESEQEVPEKAPARFEIFSSIEEETSGSQVISVKEWQARLIDAEQILTALRRTLEAMQAERAGLENLLRTLADQSQRPILNQEDLADWRVSLAPKREDLLQSLRVVEAPEGLLADPLAQTAYTEWLQSLQNEQRQHYLDLNKERVAVQERIYQRQKLLEGLVPEQELTRNLAQAEEVYTERTQDLAALELAMRWLDQAEDQLQQTLAPVLNEQTAHYLQQLTQNQYGHAYVSRDLLVRLDGSASAPMKETTLFSAGTQDQAYFALRLALANLLDPAGQLPLLLDDPFTNYDPERMLAAYQLLADLGRAGRQILLVTCHPAPYGLLPKALGIHWRAWDPLSHGS